MVCLNIMIAPRGYKETKDMKVQSSSSRVRVYSIAKELGVRSKELVALMQDLGLSVKNPSSSVTSEDAELFKTLFERFKTFFAGR